MSDRLQALSTHPALEVVITVGTEHFDNGQFTLRVRGDGRAATVQKRAGETRDFSQTLAAAEVDEFGKALAANDFTRKRTSTTPREPGDTPVKLRLMQGDTTQFEVDIWYADRYTDKQLAALLDAAEARIKSMVGAENYP